MRNDQRSRKPSVGRYPAASAYLLVRHSTKWCKVALSWNDTKAAMRSRASADFKETLRSACHGFYTSRETVSFREDQNMTLSCPRCKSVNVRRSRRKGIIDWLLRALLVLPYRCEHCSTRFYRPKSLLKRLDPTSTDVKT